LWAATAAVDSGDGGSKDSRTKVLHETLEFIELPRLRLRFQTSYDTAGNLRIMSSEHSGLFIRTSPDDYPDMGSYEEEDLRRIVSTTPFSLMLGDADGSSFLLVPSCRYDPQANLMFLQTWSNRLYPHRDDSVWLETFETRVYLYKVHESKVWLEMPSLEASLLWAYLQVCDRRYAQAANTIDCMSCDEEFSPQERFQLKQFGAFAHAVYAFAHAVYAFAHAV
jgi:hypothetical protein